MIPKIGMTVRLKQESNSINNTTSKIAPEGAIGVITKFGIYSARAYVDWNNPDYEYTRGGYHYPISWLQFKKD